MTEADQMLRALHASPGGSNTRQGLRRMTGLSSNAIDRATRSLLRAGVIRWSHLPGAPAGTFALTGAA